MAKSYKIGVFGPPQGGKTSLILQCCGLNPFDLSYEPTMVDSYHKTFTVDDNPCAVVFLDTGGSDDYENLRDQWIGDSDAIVFVYDMSDPSSLSRVQQQLRDAQTFLSNLHKQSPTAATIQIALVGNKADKQQTREVSDEKGRQVADENKATFWETSARDAKGFCDACIHLLRAIGAGRDATALKQPRTDWMQSILRVGQWIPFWVCGIRTE